jgi:pSer/pThr/pTyr-binding forkhead associated (FHA) protein
MGVVWRGHDPLLDRLVAIKVLSPPRDLETERRAEYQERFVREARAAGRLVHPNIVPIYDMGTHEGDPYLVLEYVEGGSLASLVKASGPFEPAQTARAGEQIALALGCAHAAGIVHRDVKPANALRARDGAVKLGDFGIARLTESQLTRQGHFLGSPGFSSPEQIMGEKLDGRSDLFSLGMTLYVVLTGGHPFAATAVADMVVALCRDDAPPPSRLRPGLSAAWDAFFARALARNRQRRFPDAAAMVAALAPLAAQATTQRRPGPPALFVEVVAGPDSGRRAALGEALEVGRGQPELPLTDRTVSIRHCRIEREGAKVFVVDHGGPNGTRLGSARISRAEWSVGGEPVIVGRTRLTLRTAAELAGAAEEAAITTSRLALAAPANYLLVVHEGPARGQRRALTGPLVLGRNQADFPLDDRKVSRRHACVELRSPHCVMLRDLDSQNGTWRGEERIAEIELKPGDRFRVGATILSLEVEPR